MKWTQDEALAFESARECITDMIAICTASLAEEKARDMPDEIRVAQLKAAISRLGNERSDLRLTNQEDIQRIRTEYGAKIRAYRNTGQLSDIVQVMMLNPDRH